MQQVQAEFGRHSNWCRYRHSASESTLSVHLMTNGYNTGLFDCFQDMGICLTVCFCGATFIPSALYWAQSREEECTICHCCGMVHPMWTRATIKRRNGYKGSDLFVDYFLYCCCFECATCQDGRQLKQMQKGMSTPLVQQGPSSQGQYQPAPPPQYQSPPS